MPAPYPDELKISILEARADLIAYLTALSGDRSLADDLFQDACLEAWRAYGRFQAGADFRAWFRGIGRNLLRRSRRRSARSPALPMSEELMARVEDSWSRRQTQSPRDARRQALLGCLEQLPADRRELLRRRYNDHASLQDLAAVARRSEDAMKMLFMRLRRRLEDCINEKLEREE